MFYQLHLTYLLTPYLTVSALWLATMMPTFCGSSPASFSALILGTLEEIITESLLTPSHLVRHSSSTEWYMALVAS